jgi:surface protein
MPEDETNFVLLVDTAATGATTTVTLPLGGTVNCIVDWGDDLSDTYTTTGNKTHTYAVGGKYTIRIRGVLTAFGANLSRPWLVGCTSFGGLGLTNIFACFRLSANLVEAPKRIPTLVSTLQFCFVDCASFNDDISGWYTGNVSNMQSVFLRASVFNQNISSWNTSNVTNMFSTFSGASAFNQNISSWDTSKATTMDSMFLNASVFNQEIGFWNTENVTNMADMFNGASAFNGDISNWNTSKVTSFTRLFQSASMFNQDIGSWDVSKAISMNNMFRFATKFNQDIGGWDVGQVTTVNNMFDGVTDFDQNIGGWRLSKCTNFTAMFLSNTLSTSNYDGLLTGWTDFTGTGWNNGSITSFADAGGGQVTVNTATAHGYANNHVMRITGTTNYDGSYVISNVASTSFRITATFVATETGTWNATLQSGVTFNGGGSKYSVGAATTARGVLTSAPYNWTIADGGQA